MTVLLGQLLTDILSANKGMAFANVKVYSPKERVKGIPGVSEARIFQQIPMFIEGALMATGIQNNYRKAKVAESVADEKLHSYHIRLESGHAIELQFTNALGESTMSTQGLAH